MRPLLTLIVLSSLSITLLTSCLKENSCDDQVCQNGGVCLDGTCDCPVGFTGSNCATQLAPDQIEIRGIKVEQFPGLKGNTLWDEADGPDIFFVLSDEEHPIGKPVTLFEDADENTDYTFFINYLIMQNPNQMHTIKMYDYDGAGAEHDLMGEISFRPYSDDNGFPQTITLHGTGPITFVLDYSYIYQGND